MVGKSQLKFIKNLQQKKYRNQHGMFVVEGIKSVKELLESHIKVFKIYSTNADLFALDDDRIELISEIELKKISSLKNPNKVLGIFRVPQSKEVDFQDWILALDDIRDPGNLGTIIRLCDWFGIQNLICSENTVDCYNPKVLQATMGSVARVNIVYTNLEVFLKNSKLPIFGTFMEGDPVYDIELPESGILIMGNEANGISGIIETMVDSKISIPQFGNMATESLNVAAATAIFLNEIRRT